MAITLRINKGSELTFAELDENFTDLDTRINTLEGVSNTDNQTLTLVGNNLSISGGNTVDLSGLGGSGVALTDLSVTVAAAGNANLTYDNATGVFTYTPPDLSSYATNAGLNTVIDGHLNTSTATANQVLSWDGADYAWVADQTGGGGVLSLTGHAPAVNFDFTGDGSVFAADALDYAEFAGGTAKTEASALASDSMRSSWSPISGAVYTNNQFGLYLMKGNANDALIESVGGSVNGWGDTILFGNVNDDGTSARMTSGLGITGNQVYLRTDGTEGDISIRNTNTNGNGELDLFMGNISTFAAYSRIKLEQDVITLAGFEANVTISDNNLGDLEIKKGTLGVSDAWVIGIDDANTVASSLVTFNVDGNSIWSANGTALTVNPTTTFNGAVNILGGNNLTVGTVGGAIIQVDGAGVLFGGATADANTTTLTVTDPTGVRTITLPDASGTVALLSDISSGASVTVQDDAPTSPAPTQGDLWWESDVGVLKIYYGGTWVDASPAGSSSGGIALTDLSVTVASAGSANLAYNNTTGVFTYTPPDLSSYLTSYTETDTLDSVVGRGATTTTTAVIPFYYANQAAFPNATTYHGAMAHSHADGAMFFAHSGVWNQMANSTDLDFNNLTNQSDAYKVNIQSTSLAQDHYPLMHSANTGTGITPLVDTEYRYNPDTNTLSVHNVTVLTELTAPAINPVTDTVGATGTELVINGGQATALNSQGGDLTLDAGAGAILPGEINLGVNSSNTGQINVGYSGSAVVVAGRTTFNGDVTLTTGTWETVNTSITTGAATVNVDCDSGHIVYLDASSGGFNSTFTINLVNLGNTSNVASAVTVIIKQPAGAGVLPNAIQIGGTGQTLLWQGGSAPTPNAGGNAHDVFTFSVLDLGATNVVLGQMVDYA